MESIYPAHIRWDEEEKIVQTVKQHCEQTGKYASDYLSEVGLKNVGYLIGFHHDLGKCKEEFKTYIERAAKNSKAVSRGSVNHSTAGMRYFLSPFFDSEEFDEEKITAELVSYVIGAHHGQFDCIDERHLCAFEHHMKRDGIGYGESVKNFQEQCLPKDKTDDLFQNAVAELTPIYEKIFELPDADASNENADGENSFYYTLLARLMLSALIDADRQDTAEFMSGKQYPVQAGGDDRKKQWQSCLLYMEQKLNAFACERPIDKARRAFSDQCADFAKNEGGIIRLNIPTGGGKTLSALRFALTHAACHNKARIILTSSLLSILDQNALVIRDYIPDQSLILEHHSNVVHTKDDAMWEMLTEQWSAPIVITTLVQLLNTMFDGKSACVRRFHALVNSVIVIDEVQTVPNNLLTLFDLGINFLTKICKATVVLCSATQPELKFAEHPICCNPPEMVAYDESLWKVFQRTKIMFAGKYRLEQIPDYVYSVFQQVRSLLVICNTKGEARTIYQKMTDFGIKCYHLSASMCMEHRRSVLKQIQAELKAKQPIMCVSTQVIEAGVDISFDCVVRFAAGLDSIVQAAGRCNRNGENSQQAPVYVVECTDENLKMLADINRGKLATLDLFESYLKNPSAYDNDIASEKAIARYYRNLYCSMKRGYQDTYITSLDATLYDLLSSNDTYASECKQANQLWLRQAFKTAGAYFSVFEQNTTDVIVPYEKGKKLRTRLFALDDAYQTDYAALEQILQEAKGYTVAVYAYQMQKLEENGGISVLFDGKVRVLLDGYYDEQYGFTVKQNDELWEV